MSGSFMGIGASRNGRQSADRIGPQPVAQLRLDVQAISQPPVAELETQTDSALTANGLLRISSSHNIALIENLRVFPRQHQERQP